MKQNKWIVTSLLLLAGCLLPDRAAAQWKVGVSAGYAYNQYSIDTQYAYDFNFDGRGGLTVGIPVEYGILDWLAVRADFVYLQKGYSMQRAYDQGFRDRRDHYLSLPVMARFSFGGEKLRGFLHAGGYMGYWADSRVKGTERTYDSLIDDFLAEKSRLSLHLTTAGMNSSPNATTVSMPDWWAAWACATVSTPISSWKRKAVATMH